MSVDHGRKLSQIFLRSRTAALLLRYSLCVVLSVMFDLIFFTCNTRRGFAIRSQAPLVSE